MALENNSLMEPTLISRLAGKTNDWITNDPGGWKAAMVFWLAGKLPHCNQAAPMMSEAMDHDLSLSETIKLKLHLIVCLACVRYEQHLQFLRQAAQQMATQPEKATETLPGLSTDARQRLKEALSRKPE